MCVDGTRSDQDTLRYSQRVGDLAVPGARAIVQEQCSPMRPSGRYEHDPSSGYRM